eukprot:16339_1
MITFLLLSLITLKVSSQPFSCDVNVKAPSCSTDNDCELGHLCGTRLAGNGLWVALGSADACDASCRCYCLAIATKTASALSDGATTNSEASTATEKDTSGTDEADDTNATDDDETDNVDNTDGTKDAAQTNSKGYQWGDAMKVTPCIHTTDSNEDSMDTTDSNSSDDSMETTDGDGSVDSNDSDDSDEVLSAIFSDNMRDSQAKQEHDVYVLLGNIWILIICIVAVNVIVLAVWCAFKRSKKLKMATITKEYMMSDQEVEEEQRCDVNSVVDF